MDEPGAEAEQAGQAEDPEEATDGGDVSAACGYDTYEENVRVFSPRGGEFLHRRIEHTKIHLENVI